MTRPLVLKTAKRRHWLVLEGEKYKRIMPSRLRLRLRELGFAWACAGPKGNRRPSEILERYGALVSRKAFDAVEKCGAQ